MFDLGHSDQADIGECGWQVPVLPQEPADCGDILRNLEVTDQLAPFDQGERPVGAESTSLQQEKCFCQNRFADMQRSGELMETIANPPMKFRVAVKKCDQRASVNDDPAHSPNLAR